DARGVHAVARSGDRILQDAQAELELRRVRRLDALRAAPQLEQRGLEHHYITHPVLRWSRSPRPAMMSMGSGKTMVVFFSTPISVSVCRWRSCSVAGSVEMIFAASARRCEAANSPSAWISFARFSRSASACLAMARSI